MNTLIFLTGAPGTGKSTTATELEAGLESYVTHSQCQVRRDLGHKRYIPGRNEEAFAELIRRTSVSLENEEPVILDRAVARSDGRQRVYNITAQYNLFILIL